jgi:hypothetical protein
MGGVCGESTHQQTHPAALFASHLPSQSLQALQPASIGCQLPELAMIAGKWRRPSPAKTKVTILMIFLSAIVGSGSMAAQALLAQSCASCLADDRCFIDCPDSYYPVARHQPSCSSRRPFVHLEGEGQVVRKGRENPRRNAKVEGLMKDERTKYHTSLA